MIIDITDYDPDTFAKAIVWMNENLGQCFKDGNKGADILMHADNWRIYKHENSVEGFYETTWYLEFDSDVDGTTFLLRWS
jgi:hypothetical protein